MKKIVNIGNQDFKSLVEQGDFYVDKTCFVKVIDKSEEGNLQETAKAALAQIEKMEYEQDLRNKSVRNIRKYGFCFEGKKVLIAQ